MVLVGDSSDDNDSVVDEDEDEDEIIVQSTMRHQLSQAPRSSRQHLTTNGRVSQTHRAANHLPPPTLSPSRRELDRWDPSCLGISTACCTPSYAGSTATTASILSEDEYLDRVEDVRSNATTQVVSHRQHEIRSHGLLSSTLASAEQRLKAQLVEEEERAKALDKRRRQRRGAC